MSTYFLTGAATALLSVSLLQAAPANAAEIDPSLSVFLDGRQLAFQTQPVIEKGSSLVPMRTIFEAEGAEVTWNNKTQTVTATKDGVILTYRLGETTAYKNQERLNLPVPGKIIDKTTMVPLRFISETLGNVVKWHEYSGSITISSARNYETAVEYGINLRVSPGKENDSDVIRMLPKNEQVHVIREINADWLEVQTKDDTIGFISAKPMYTDYASPALVDKQADELLAFGSKFLATPYEFGAKSGQTKTFDCSSFVQYVFNEVLAIDLPRVSYDQALKGKEVKVDELRKGDLLFFSARGLDIGHVGIYAGDGRVLHTYSKVQGVHFEDFDDGWKKRFVTARRLF
ncbi:stalk domain-containing protein [Cohnella lupini]|nr:stalk domain-containing protein [Cohnella lupini]